METLHRHLAQLSDHLPALYAGRCSKPTLLARLWQNHIALLETTANSAALRILSVGSPTSAASSRLLPIQLPADAHTLVPAHDMLAVIGARSISIIDHPLLASPSVYEVARPIFAARPALTVIEAAWAPHAPGFLLVLMSDATLRLFDVVSPTGVNKERMRLRVVAKATSPVSFTFGRGQAWSALSVYVLMANGSIFVVAPIAPIGTRIPHLVWTDMCRNTEANLPPADQAADTEPQDMSWPARQNDLQHRFLTHVFERSSAGDMVAVREFKPAPLLFQGPLFVEHDDVNNVSKDRPRIFKSLSLLNCGSDIPPILLRASEDGHVSVLLALENFEPQWFLSADPTVGSSQTPLEEMEEYATCAAQVAPSLLCFEHVSFGTHPVTIVPLGGGSHADVIFAVSRSAVYSLRLSFISALGDAEALKRTVNSSLVQVLTTGVSRDDGAAEVENAGSELVGISSHCVRGHGPVAIALTRDGCLHASSPVRWVSNFDVGVPPSFLLSADVAEDAWMTQKMASRRRTSSATGLAKDVARLLQLVQQQEEKVGGRVAAGTFGSISVVPKFSTVLEVLEGRVNIYAGGADRPGIADSLLELATVLSTFGKTLKERTRTAHGHCADAKHCVGDVESSEMNVRRKLARVEEVGGLLNERVQNLMALVVERGQWELSPVEALRFESLKERSRRLVFLQRRVKEIAIAVRNTGRAGYVANNPDAGDRGHEATEARNPPWKSGSASRPMTQWFSGMSLKEHDEPLARRRPEWTDHPAATPLSTVDLQRIRVALEKHSAEIAKAMELDASLRKQLSVS